MGGNNSRNQRMNADGSGDENSPPGSLSDGDNTDLASILQYLIRSGQVRVLSSGSRTQEGAPFSFTDDEEDDEVIDDGYLETADPPHYDPNPETNGLESSDFARTTRLQTTSKQSGGTYKANACQLLKLREMGMSTRERFTRADCCEVASNYIPNDCEIMASYHHKAFCGTYSQDGDIFLTASQDRCIRIYNTHQERFCKVKEIRARDVGWSVLDTAFSPDGNYLIYSSWSDCIHLCNIYGSQDTHTALHLLPESESSFAIFSLMFSQDNKEILGGANDGNLYVFDREKNERTLKVDAHEDDTNAVCFADHSSQILYSGGDDGLVKVWDRRTLRESDPHPVGILAGHSDGITYIDTKGDARHLISNSKDQSIKLWDIRRFSSEETVQATKTAVGRQHWDYRWQQVPTHVKRKIRSIPGDSSLMTYRGHSVLHTLVRGRFSPVFSTGQKYIYTGCATGSVIIYDALTGKIVRKLDGHRACVRDISWHPYENNILSTSWDGTVGRWTYTSQVEYDTDESDVETTDDDTDSDSGERRRLRKTKKSISRREKRKKQKEFNTRRRCARQRMVIID